MSPLLQVRHHAKLFFKSTSSKPAIQIYFYQIEEALAYMKQKGTRLELRLENFIFFYECFRTRLPRTKPRQQL